MEITSQIIVGGFLYLKIWQELKGARRKDFLPPLASVLVDTKSGKLIRGLLPKWLKRALCIPKRKKLRKNLIQIAEKKECTEYSFKSEKLILGTQKVNLLHFHCRVTLNKTKSEVIINDRKGKTDPWDLPKNPPEAYSTRQGAAACLWRRVGAGNKASRKQG